MEKQLNKKRSLLLVVISVLLLTLMTMSVSAITSNFSADNVTVYIPEGAFTNITSGTVTINVTFNKLYAEMNYSNLRTVYIQSAGLTANTTLAIANHTARNLTGSGTEDANVTFDFVSTIVEDGTDYTMIFDIWNGSSGATGFGHVNKSVSIVRVDNTVPTAASSLTPTSDTDGDVTFSSTVTGRETTACTLYFVTSAGPSPGASSYTMTHSGDTCSHALTSVPEQSYIWYVQASDGTNTTNSAQQTTNVDITQGGGYNPVTGVISEEVAGFPIWIILIGIVVVVWLIIGKRK